MTEEELGEIIEQHKKWLNDGTGKRANLRRADLSEANLSGADLSEANLSEANLSEATLLIANLGGANLSGANLSGANLSGANLSKADLSEANLSKANLGGANLRGANLFKTTLPLWCGGLFIKMDRVQMAQLAYHFCSMDCDDKFVAALQNSIIEFANEFTESRTDLTDKKLKQKEI